MIDHQAAIHHDLHASLLRAGGERAGARAALERAWAANPRHAAAPQLAGELAAEAGDFDAARLWFERARRAAPRWSAPQRRLAELSP